MINYRLAYKGDGSLGFQQIVDGRCYELTVPEDLTQLGLYDVNLNYVGPDTDLEKNNPYHDNKGRFTNAFVLHYKTATDFVHGKSANQVISDVVKHHKTKAVTTAVVSMAISTLISYLSKSGGYNTLHGPDADEHIDHTVRNLSLSLKLTKEQSKDILKESVTALKNLRKKKPTEVEKAEDDPVLEILTKLEELLEKYVPTVEKANPYHDEKGRFASSDSGSAAVAFHGTSSHAVELILKHGLKVKPVTNWQDYTTFKPDKGLYKDERGNSVFVSTKKVDALNYAVRRTKIFGGSPVVLTLKIPSNNWKEFKADEVHWNNHGYFIPKDISPDWITLISYYKKSEDQGITLYMVVDKDIGK